MHDELAWVVERTGARSVERVERIQSLWGGYGELSRLHLAGASAPSVILKRIVPPRGATSLSDARKRRSYEIEATFYRTFAPRCDARSRVARLLGDAEVGARLLLLEDLDPGTGERARRARGEDEITDCLSWLAAFHARFVGVAPEGLWPTGTYWHLATRPEELAAIDEPELREAAPLIDARLEGARWKTLVHGDAKEANFCFGAAPLGAVDFQYVGGGCGMKDVAYLLAGNVRSEAAEQRWLDVYFAALRGELARAREEIDGEALEAEWRALYRLAAADFHRFLAGWARSHWRQDAWGQRIVREVLRAL